MTFSFKDNCASEFEMFLMECDERAIHPKHDKYSFGYATFARCFYTAFQTEMLIGLKVSKSFHRDGKFETTDINGFSVRYIFDPDINKILRDDSE